MESRTPENEAEMYPIIAIGKSGFSKVICIGLVPKKTNEVM